MSTDRLVWVEIGDPPIVFVPGDVGAHLSTFASTPQRKAIAALIEIGQIREQASGQDPETPSVSIKLDNRGGLVARAFASPPIGQALRIYARRLGANPATYSTMLLYTFQVSAVSFGDDVEVTAQA